jgi:protein TonB
MSEAILTAERKRSERRRKLGTAAGLAVGAAMVAVVASALLTKTPQDHRKYTQIVVLRLPPPPPPPEKPPEPPKPQDIVKLEQPRPLDEPKPQEQPPAGPLGVDAKGTGPGDSFGLAGRPGGHDITLGGQGGGGLGQGLFGNAAARFIAQELARDEKLRGTGYRVELRVWISPDGHFERYELVRGTGNADTDALIREGLTHLGTYRQPIPENIQQPLRIRVTSSDA